MPLPLIPMAIGGGLALGGAIIGEIGAAGERKDRDRKLDKADTHIDRVRRESQVFSRQLQDGAAGKGPSVADQQARNVMSQAMAQQQALAASARPGMGGLAMRQAAQEGSRVSAKIGQEAMAARLQEQQQAQRLLQTMLAQRQTGEQNMYNAVLQQYSDTPALGETFAGTMGGLGTSMMKMGGGTGG